MDFGFLTQFVNTKSFTTFLDELYVILGILLVKLMEKRYPKTPRSYVEGLRSLLLVMMPSIAFFNVLVEAKVPVYFSVLPFIFIFVGWFAGLFIRHGENIPKVLALMFVAILGFVIFMYFLTYSFFH